MEKATVFKTDFYTNAPVLNPKSRVFSCNWIHRAKSCGTNKIFHKCIPERWNFLLNAGVADELWEYTWCRRRKHYHTSCLLCASSTNKQKVLINFIISKCWGKYRPFSSYQNVCIWHLYLGVGSRFWMMRVFFNVDEMDMSSDAASYNHFF